MQLRLPSQTSKDDSPEPPVDSIREVSLRRAQGLVSSRQRLAVLMDQVRLQLAAAAGSRRSRNQRLCVYGLSSYLQLPRFSPTDAGGSAPQLGGSLLFCPWRRRRFAVKSGLSVAARKRWRPPPLAH